MDFNRKSKIGIYEFRSAPRSGRSTSGGISGNLWESIEFQVKSSSRNCRNPWALVDAVEKLETEAHSKPMKVNEAVSHLFIVNPLSGFSATMFSTHPPMQNRISRLKEMRGY